MKKISFAFIVPFVLVLFDLVPLGLAAAAEEVLTHTSSSSHRGAAGAIGGNLFPRELKGKNLKAAKRHKIRNKSGEAALLTELKGGNLRTAKRHKIPNKSDEASVLTASPSSQPTDIIAVVTGREVGVDGDYFAEDKNSSTNWRSGHILGTLISFVSSMFVLNIIV
jgi:hypothetical protein